MNKNNTQTAAEIVAEASRDCKNGCCNFNINFDEISWYYDEYYETLDSYITATALFLITMKDAIKSPKELCMIVISSLSSKYYKGINLIAAIDYLLKTGSKPDMTKLKKCLKSEKELVYTVVDNIEDENDTDVNAIICTGGHSPFSSLCRGGDNILDSTKLKSSIESFIGDNGDELIDILKNIASLILSKTSVEKNTEEGLEELTKPTPETGDNKTEVTSETGMKEEKIISENSGVNKEIPDNHTPVIGDTIITLEKVPCNYRKPKNGTAVTDDRNHNWLLGKIQSMDPKHYKLITRELKKFSSDKKTIDAFHVIMINYFMIQYNINSITIVSVDPNKVLINYNNLSTTIFHPYYEKGEIKMLTTTEEQAQQQTA